MAALSECACLRCREQKLRCSREQPMCERCARLHGTCVYPSPPDRKQLAATRTQTRKRKREQNDAKSVPHNPTSEQRPAVTTLQTPGSHHSDSGVWIAPSVANGVALSSAVEKLLRDVYFAYVFNSTMLIHRAKFESALSAGTLPQHILLAVYAFATNFLDPPCELVLEYEQEVQSLGDVHALGQSWARSAGEEVLRGIDEPDLVKVQTCMILSLYWFARGDSRRNVMFSGIAYRATRELIINDEDDAEAELLYNGIQEETRRRCFWVSYLANCVNSDHYVVGSSSDTLIAKVPLPISQRSFNYILREPQITLSDMFDQELAKTNPVQKAEPNLLGELMRLISQWSKIRDHIEMRKRISPKESVLDLLTLDDWLVEFLRGLTPSLVYSKENLHAQVAEQQSLSFAILHPVYHQCRLVLHASLVPHFSGQPPLEKIPQSIIRSSAKTAMDSAQAISRIAMDILTLEEDVARLAPFVGYTMYVAASVHIAFISSKSNELRMEAQSNLEPVLKVLKIMKPYWKNLDKLWERIHVLYETQASRFHGINPISPNSVEQAAETRRDSGRLMEPLSDSVLQYGLRRLGRKVVVDATSSTAQGLEAMADSHRMARSLQGSVQSQSTPPTATNSLPINQNLQDGQFTILPTQNNNELSQNVAFNNADDWWPFDLDPFAPALLPYDDLFGENMML